MSGYTPLFSTIVCSSIWDEDNCTRIVWITMLALADASGNVESSIKGLAHQARVTVTQCNTALEILKAPDPYSKSKNNDGKRIEEIEGGWHVINHAMYRNKAKSRAEYMRKYREEKRKEAKENKETNTNTNTNRLQSVTGVTVTQFITPLSKDDIERWENIAFTVGLTEEEADLARMNFEANGWKRSNNIKIEDWSQVSALLTYWRNNKHKFTDKKKATKTKRDENGLTPYDKAKQQIERLKNAAKNQNIRTSA